MIPSYSDFLIIENFVSDLNFSLLVEKNLTNAINNNIKFGIILPTYKISKDYKANGSRANYVTTVEVITDAINSIKLQTYKNWFLYVIGDAYEDDKEIKDVLSSLLKPEQYKYYNLPKPGERDANITPEELRFTGGIGAMNKGISMCNADNIEYISRMDHDDKWKPKHLELLAKAYTQYPNLAFVFTQGRKKVDAGNSNKKYAMFPDAKPTLDLDNKGYVIGSTAHSSVSWCPKLTGKFTYRDPHDQKTTEPKNNKTLPGDVDMFKRMIKTIKEKGHHYMYIPQMTTYVRNRKGKF